MFPNQAIKILFLGLYLSVYQGFGQSEKLKVIKFEDLRKMMNRMSDTTLVVHFWATWCKPCVEELPNFEKLSKEYSSKKIRFVMVSMDFPKDIDEKVIPFITKNNITSEIVLLNEPDYNAWIDEVDKEWSGIIPATLMLNLTMRKRIFFEGQANLSKFTEQLKEMTPAVGDN
ncbi:MAG: TlpA family protein disulfide reductase [Arcicella sp.]|nr:TlpA family protein disulfide reductase [Arcicella sp.]